MANARRTVCRNRVYLAILWLVGHTWLLVADLTPAQRTRLSTTASLIVAA